MATTTCAQTLRVFFCGDSKTPYDEDLQCCNLVSEAFGKGRVYLSSPSPFLSAESERIARATTLLARNILELHDLSVKKCPQRFLVFTYGEGIKVVELVLKKLLTHKVDIDVYSFGGTETIISTKLASVVHHYVFQAHLSPQHSILSKMHSIFLKMKLDRMSLPVAIMQEASEQEDKKAHSHNGEDFFDPELMSRMKKYQGYFDSHSVTFLLESPPKSPDAQESCEFFAYAKVIQKIAQSHYSTQD